MEVQRIEAGDAISPEAQASGGAARWAVIGIFVLLSIGTLYLASDFLMPLALAFLLALVLSPIMRFFARNRVPHALAAGFLVAVLGLTLVAGAYGLGGPLGTLVDKLPQSIASVERKLAGIMLPVRKVLDASDRVDDITQPQGGPQVQEVVVKEQPLIASVASGAPGLLAKTVFTIALLFFLLASGDLFYAKMVQALPTLTDKKRALNIAYSMERELSRYLFTITLINAVLGVAIGATMWGIGMPNPVLWGVLAALFNFVPYLGALAGVALCGVVALVSFESFGAAVVAPMLYLGLTTLEGHFITPSVVGRRFEMNAVAVLLAIAFWGWIWGVMGALMAVPILVAVRVFCMHIDSLSGLGLFLASRGDSRETERIESAGRDAVARPAAGSGDGGG